MAITASGTTLTFNDGTTQTTAGKTGTVTSVATGNGLSGGTITTSGTLVVACPTADSVGSYAFAGFYYIGGNKTFGNNYSGGTSTDQLQAAYIQDYYGTTLLNIPNTNPLSGTWKWLGGNIPNVSQTSFAGIACRVS